MDIPFKFGPSSRIFKPTLVLRAGHIIHIPLILTGANIETPPSKPFEQIDRSLIQINVSTDELEQRIQNFIERKREQVNLSNINDFIPSKRESETEDVDTCARVRTQFVRRSDSKGHLKIRKVNNEWGPMTVQASDFHMEAPSDAARNLPTAISERVLTLEKFLNISGPVSPDIYKRLKEMEDKISYLQAVSPEYAQFWKTKPDAESAQDNLVDYTFSADDISRKIEELERGT